MTARVVALNSPEAGESRVGGTPAERVALVVELSAMLWARTGKPLPDYTRGTMPIVVTTLRASRDRS
ncbi:MAG: hypothetical protein O2973_06760 [Gemmatimonadetes bacterium]|nr:hypothetical protein [Gemmatimonadota bacterium]